MTFWQYHPIEEQGWINLGITASIPQIDRGHELNMDNLYNVESIFFIDNPNNECNVSNNETKVMKMLNPNYKQLWNDKYYKTFYDLFYTQKSIIGFFIGDGLVYLGVEPSEINIAAQFIKENISTSIIYMNEATEPMRSGLDQCNHYHNYQQISSYIDWFSINIYHYDNNEEFVNETVKPFYEKYVFPKMDLSSQFAFCVPGSYASNNNERCDEQCYEQMSINDANQYYEWGINDERIIGLMPWHWVSVVDNTSNEEIGTQDMPQTKANWERIGKLIIENNKQLQ